MIDVTLETFETEVIAASSTLPVLVDFWAPWCGPCKVIGPLLEKLETAYAGRFKLVKVDSDQEPEISQAFGVRSIPTCMLVVGGQPVDGFVGALPEGKIREFLDKHLPPPAEDVQDEALDSAEEPPLSAGDAMERLAQAVAAKPDDDAARVDYLRALLREGEWEDARRAFEPAAAKASVVRGFESAKLLLDAIDSIASETDFSRTIAGFDQKIAVGKRDFDARLGRAQILIAERRWTDAMDELLEILMRDKSWGEEIARKTYVAILDVIEPPKPKVADGVIPPDDPTVATYRRRLSSVVLS